MRAKKNILQLVDSFNEGGSERQAVQLTRLLQQSDRYRLHVACLNRTGRLREEIERLGIVDVPEYPLKSFYDRNAAAQLRRFAAFLREREIDVVHTHDYYTNIFGMAGTRLAGVSVRIASRRQSSVRAASKRFVERLAYNLSHAVVANCEEVRTQLVREGVPPHKIKTIYNGLDTGRVMVKPGATRDELLARLGLPRDGRRSFVTIVANIRAVKDHATFLRAARRVRATLPHARFVIAGGGELTDSTRELAALLTLQDDVFFTGPCERVAELLSISDVCVLSSVSEGFSNAILEYMAAGRPVVATDVGGAREAVVEGETGYLVQRGDDRAMAERIAELLQDPARARAMGERGRRLIESKFSCEEQLSRTSELYDELLANNRIVTRSQRRMARGHLSPADARLKFEKGYKEE
jgi:glycosyltransferase involved in cell wall biosynthesis